MYKYNADILPSSFDNFFSKLPCIHDHGTRQFQEIFIINILELITVKNAAICRSCCMGLHF